jgi:hypothetical protein
MSLDLNISPYLDYSKKLILKKRKGVGGTMFCHQENNCYFAEYGFTDLVLLKASLIHYLIKDRAIIGFLNFESIQETDDIGTARFRLIT